MNIKYLLASLGAFLCVFFIALISEFDKENIWLIPPFGASLVLVMAIPKSPLAQPKNVIFGHIIAASAGVLIFQIFGSNPLSIGLGLGLAVYLMLATETTHPPAGANPILAILGSKSFEFVFIPVAVGAIFIVIFSLFYNRIIKINWKMPFSKW